MTTKNKKTAFYTALAKAPGLLKEYIKQYTQGQVDFPDELVEAFTQAQGDVKKIEQMCNNLKKSKEGAQIMKVAEQVYNAAQQEIDFEVNNSTGLFKDGGKFQYLRKLAGGGNTTEDGKKKKQPQNKSVAKRRDLDSETGFRTVIGDEGVDVATPQGYGFQRDTTGAGEIKYMGSYVYPLYNREDGHIVVPAFDESRGRVISEDSFGRRDTTYFNYPDERVGNGTTWILNGTAPDQEAAKKLYYQFLEYVNPHDYPEVQKAKAEKHDKGGLIREPKDSISTRAPQVNYPRQTGYWVPTPQPSGFGELPPIEEILNPSYNIKYKFYPPIKGYTPKMEPNEINDLERLKQLKQQQDMQNLLKKLI